MAAVARHASSRVRAATADDGPAVLALLRSHPGLEVDFAAAEFLVAEDAGQLVACGRLRRHPDGAFELASVATEAASQHRGLASAIVRGLLAARNGPVFALALAPRFFSRHGFTPVAAGRLPASLRAKADGLCASQEFVPMMRP